LNTTGELNSWLEGFIKFFAARITSVDKTVDGSDLDRSLPLNRLGRGSLIKGGRRPRLVKPQTGLKQNLMRSPGRGQGTGRERTNLTYGSGLRGRLIWVGGGGGGGGENGPQLGTDCGKR